jgi:hypothetical protein
LDLNVIIQTNPFPSYHRNQTSEQVVEIREDVTRRRSLLFFRLFLTGLQRRSAVLLFWQLILPGLSEIFEIFVLGGKDPWF